MADTVEVLKAAREKIAQGWTQGNLARDAEGRPVYPTSFSAVCWCASGAVIAATHPRGGYLGALRLVEEEIGGRVVPWWNDDLGRTQAEVLAAFDAAIAKATAQ